MKRILLIVAIMAASFTSFAQVGIGTTDPQGTLDLVATDNGLILTRVATTGSVTTPINGMIVYDVSAKCFKGYQDGSWTDCGLMLNAAAAASTAVLAQIGLEADAAGTVPSVVTVADLNTILPALTGVLSANETAYQDYIDANPTLFASPATQAEVQAAITAVNIAGKDTTTAVVELAGTGGRIWMDRNLGATQVATSSTDPAAYGDLYQWGRAKDGHESSTSAITATTVTSADPGNGDFITAGVGTGYNWTNFAGEDGLWQAGLNDPCPIGYRIPTEAELSAELGSFSTNNATGAFTALKLPLSGYRADSNGTLYEVGISGYYWLSTVSGISAGSLAFYSSSAVIGNNNRAFGFSVRCLKE